MNLPWLSKIQKPCPLSHYSKISLMTLPSEAPAVHPPPPPINNVPSHRNTRQFNPFTPMSDQLHISPCSLTRSITSHSMENINLAFHSLLRWKMTASPSLEGKYFQHGSTRRARRAASRSRVARSHRLSLFVPDWQSLSGRDWCVAGSAELSRSFFVCAGLAILVCPGLTILVGERLVRVSVEAGSTELSRSIFVCPRLAILGGRETKF